MSNKKTITIEIDLSAVKPGFIATDAVTRATLKAWAVENPDAVIRVSDINGGYSRRVLARELKYGCSKTKYFLEKVTSYTIGPGFVADTPSKRNALKAWAITRPWAAIQCGKNPDSVRDAKDYGFDADLPYTLLPEWFSLPDGFTADTDESRQRLVDWAALNPGRRLKSSVEGLYYSTSSPIDVGVYRELAWTILPKALTREEMSRVHDKIAKLGEEGYRGDVNMGKLAKAI